MSYTVTVTGITKSFGSHVALDHVDLAIETNSIFALLGPNGAGKTTMVRILSTLIRPDAGAAVIAGHDLLADPAGVRRSISLTGQYAAVDDLLTGQENLEMMARLLGLARRAARARADELLAAFGLAGARHRRARAYSGGMRRRLDLAISMIVRPRLLFLDEPTSGLDPRSREQVWGAVRDLADDGVTILLTTQYLEEADQLAGMIAVLDRGRVIASGTADELKSGLGTEVVRLQFTDDASYELAVRSLRAVRADRRLGVVEVETGGSADDVHQILARLAGANLAAARISTHRPSLDDVFLALTGSGPGSGDDPARPAAMPVSNLEEIAR
jgi:ABC-2 type transport system ATP-binding protein